MLAAALIELDGVLVDVTGARADSLAAGFAAEQIPFPTAFTPADWHAPFDDLVRASPPARALDETTRTLIALRAERDYTARLATGVTLAEGARCAVESLGAELRIALVTNWRRADAERFLALAGLDSYVRFVAADDDAPPTARHADRVARTVARLRRGLSSSDVIVALMASSDGLTAARAAGARTVLVAAEWAVATPSGPPPADARLVTIRGLTAPRLAAALDCPLPHLSTPTPRR